MRYLEGRAQLSLWTSTNESNAPMRACSRRRLHPSGTVEGIDEAIPSSFSGNASARMNA